MAEKGYLFGVGLKMVADDYYVCSGSEGVLHRIPCRHRAEEMKKELQIMVDNGCLVKDVIVEHPVYGELSGQLNLSTRHDVDEFMVRVRKKDAAPLSDLTGGIHLHTVLFPDEETYQRVLKSLREAGFLFEN
jgi:transcriptional regulator of NAD metabolism